jgi:DNA-binding transcriptional MerR regulator/uncharacterized damage-inducible protein DinB
LAGRTYKIHEFAKLAGVTVKALHHYDRLGLMQPGRTEAGYRVYFERDLETLEQIVALKFLGIPLKQIGAVLKRSGNLADALSVQRKALEEQKVALEKAILAIQAAEASLATGAPAVPAILKTIIEVIDMQDGIAVMKKYYSEEAWERHQRYYEEGPSAEWRELYREGKALLGSDPGSAAAQDFLERWFELSRRAYEGDLEVQTDSTAAWMDRANWPEPMKERMAEFKVEEISNFVRQASLATTKQYFSEEKWAKLKELQERIHDHSRMWQARVDLFRDIEKASEEDPTSAAAQALVARWDEQQNEASGGDEEIKSMLLKGWSNRKNWPPSMRWRVESLHMMSFERFERAADFLDRARAAREPQPKTEEIHTAPTLAEFDQEMAGARSMLERVPEEKFAWTPHEKSMTLGKLANHIAGMPVGMSFVLTGLGTKPEEANTKKALLEVFDKRTDRARKALEVTLEAAAEERLNEMILVTATVRKTRGSALRWFLSHMIHHRAQLGVYLRMLGVAVPSMYGPSADE